MKARILSGPFAGREGVIVDRDPKWAQIRVSEPGWPFPVLEWFHRSDFELIPEADPLADMPEALV